MPSDELAVTRCELSTTVDLLAAFDDRLLDHLDVDDDRTIVLYHDAILDVTVRDVDLSAVRAVTVAIQGFSRLRDLEPEVALAAFCEELVAGTDIARR